MSSVTLRSKDFRESRSVGSYRMHSNVKTLFSKSKWSLKLVNDWKCSEYTGDLTRTNLDLRPYLELVKTSESLDTILDKYLSDNVREYLEKFYSNYIGELAALLLFIDERYSGLYGAPELGVAFDSLDQDKPVFIVITIPRCGKDEWSDIVREVKEELRRNGLDELRRKVALVCHQGLMEETD